MAFKIKRSIPLLFEGTIDPGKKLETNKPDPYKTNQRGFSSYSIDKDKKTVEDHKSYDPSKHSKVRNFFESIGPGRAKDRLDTVKSNTPPSVTSKVDAKVSVSETKKSIEGSGTSGGSSTKGTPSDKRTYNPFVKTPPAPPNDTKQETIVLPPEETKASGRQSKLSQTSLGKKGKQKKFGDEVSMKSDKFVPASRKTTVKAAPKDNSRKAIKARKTADKKAGVSKSQMRANKAKSKSEAASAKAKKSKNPSYRAQLTAKSERLAKRAARKGGSPAKKAK
jgi:hypothetical protein